MARYFCGFKVMLPIESLRQALAELLTSCGFQIIYDTGDYMMARELSGSGISFAKLVTVEILIDRSLVVESEVQMTLVMKNEELPLQLNNHCRQMFDQVSVAFEQSRYWQLIESSVH